MRFNSRQRLSIAVTVLLLLAWCTVILLLGDFSRLGIYGWLSFFSVPVCAVAILFCTAFYKPIKNDVSAIALPFTYSAILLFLTASINAIFIFIGSKQIGAFIVAANILLLIAYLLITILGNMHLWNLSNRTIKVEQATAFSTTVSRTLGFIVSQTDDPKIHQSLVRLKEMIDYSSNTSFATDETSTIIAKLDDLKEATAKRADPEIIQNLISEITMLWKRRNSML